MLQKRIDTSPTSTQRLCAINEGLTPRLGLVIAEVFKGSGCRLLGAGEVVLEEVEGVGDEDEVDVRAIWADEHREVAGGAIDKFLGDAEVEGVGLNGAVELEVYHHNLEKLALIEVVAEQGY